MLPQPALDRGLNPVIESTPPSLTGSAKEVLSLQDHSWSLLRGHQTSGCWLPEPQMGRGGEGPLENGWSDLPLGGPKPGSALTSKQQKWGEA